MNKQSKSIIHILLFMALFASVVGEAAIASRARAIGTILYVIPGGATSHGCDTWGNACELSYALGSVATPGDRLWVEQGTYTPVTTDPTDRTATFTLKNGVEIYGGFVGIENDQSQRDPAANVTTLSGEINGTDTSDNSYHVVTGGGTDSTAVLDGFTITEGNANSILPDGNGDGGGLYNTASSPTLRMLKFSNNSAYLYGGGVYNISGSDPTLTNVIFSGNTAGVGGGMHNGTSSNPSLTNITFDSNHADGNGGGMVNEGNPTLTNVTFSTNTTQALGGGMFNFSNSKPKLTNVTFHDNYALGGGGGMYNYSSSLTLTDVTFRDNNTTNSGGAVVNYSQGSSRPAYTNVTFENNSAHGSGGAMFNGGEGGTVNMTLANVTFSGNHADSRGGAIWNLGFSTGTSNSVMKNVTFSGNSADIGGAVDNQTWDTGTTTATMTNVILWGDSATTSGTEISNEPNKVSSVTSTLDHSVVAVCPTGNTCTNQVTGNPLLIALESNGGFTQTMALPSGSSALYAGDNATCAASPVNNTSQNGVTRPQGLMCDIGSYEKPVTKITTTFRSVGGSDGFVLESSEKSNVGGSVNSTATTFRLGDDAAKKQYRGLLSFGTGSIPDNTVISQVTLKLTKQGVVGGGNPVTTFQGFMLDMKKGFFGATALEKGDFQAAATHTYGPRSPSLVGGAYIFDLTSGASYINKAATNSGLTQIRVRFQKDDNNNAIANYLSLYSGNYPTASVRPALIVQYYVP